MNSLDKDLLFLYSENARFKIKNLSTILKKSSQRLKYSIKVLESEGIISKPFCIFDYSYFGLILFRVYFKGGYISEKDKSQIIQKLSENPYVVSMYELSGEFDLAIEIAAPNPSKFNKELKKIAGLIPTLNNYKIILNLVTHIYPKVYLPKNLELVNQISQEIIIGGDRAIASFDENEMKIIQCILKNPKIRLINLGKESGLNSKTANTILKSLIQKRFIRGFKYIVDTNKLGIYKSRLFLKLHNVSPEREAQLMSFMLAAKEIVQSHKTVGDWDVEIDIESPDSKKIRYLTIQIREEFKDLIETFNISEFYQYYERSYLPFFLFQKEENQKEIATKF